MTQKCSSLCPSQTKICPLKDTDLSHEFKSTFLETQTVNASPSLTETLGPQPVAPGVSISPVNSSRDEDLHSSHFSCLSGSVSISVSHVSLGAINMCVTSSPPSCSSSSSRLLGKVCVAWSWLLVGRQSVWAAAQTDWEAEKQE
ncbi:hypothetical protein ILYODFUR_029193 [Ilyodon furcidens]|uniref:Uncharacterized protein n=1 Tax=Ilyodon furcidens TaxID=33524 RepID=A0ABV0T3H4_9TELE